MKSLSHASAWVSLFKQFNSNFPTDISVSNLREHPGFFGTLCSRRLLHFPVDRNIGDPVPRNSFVQLAYDKEVANKDFSETIFC